MSKQFWAGAALGALTVGAAVGLAASRSNCCYGGFGNSYFGGYTGFNSFGYNPFSTFGYGFCCTPKVFGPTPFESFGFSNRTLSRLDLGYYI